MDHSGQLIAAGDFVSSTELSTKECYRDRRVVEESVIANKAFLSYSANFKKLRLDIHSVILPP